MYKEQHTQAQRRLAANNTKDKPYTNYYVQDDPAVGAVAVQHPVHCQDLGPDLQHEFPYIAAMQHSDWPLVSDTPQGSSQEPRQAATSGTPPTQQVPHKSDSLGRPLAPCGCLLRTPPPPVPNMPPFQITEGNTAQVQQWFLTQYAASAFNNCVHQPLPLMTGLPPLRILLKDNVTPHALHRPATIPLHWLDKVKQDLFRDIDLGVIEPVPQNTPTTWCARMHIVGKKTGDPRRVVDLRNLNSATIRQTHHTEPRFSQATSVPPNTWRFCSDAWNGYHSVPIAPQDRHLTTFLTPWGRMRYRVAPQGALSSGDGFTYWYDLIMRHLPRKKKCVDDVLGWASTLQQLFFDTAEFLTHTSQHGVVQNGKKFTSGHREIEYVGFLPTQDGVRPSDDTLSAITNFPRPTDITGVRSWFGLVEQVAFAFSKSDIMSPFKPLLKKNSSFAWSQELQDAFDSDKSQINSLVKNGVKSYQLGSHTFLVTDWSRFGIGFVLWQKTCSCQDIHPSCCKNGWIMVLCGSRYCTPAEIRYHPIEGELLGVVWALHKTRQYTLGCDKLLILVDHKSILGLLTNREIGDIDNPRLEHLAEKLLRWQFSIEHVAGSKRKGPDALSRFPSPHTQAQLGALGRVNDKQVNWLHELEAQILSTTSSRFPLVISWELLRKTAISDPTYAALLHTTTQDTDQHLWDTVLKEYKQFKDNLSSLDGVVTYKGRAVIPQHLRQQVLDALHRAHQGKTGMSHSAQDAVWWPGHSKDIKNTRSLCSTCTRNAPSQPASPPVHPPLPDYPFQLISFDYFVYAGSPYLVIVNRYSGWPLLIKCKTETAAELISTLRTYFSTYGTPEQLASDGGPSYTASSTQRFLQDWGVTHRISSAYHPHSNLRAETAVKFMKRLIAQNTGPRGSLDSDAFALPMLQYRNTPDRDTHRSPAQVLFARNLRDALPHHVSQLQLRPEWVLTADLREKALARRHQVREEQLSQHTKELKPLKIGDSVQVQNQTGPNKNKWETSGVIVEVMGHQAYMVKMDGSGRTSKRNRRFLRLILPYNRALLPTSLPLLSKDNEMLSIKSQCTAQLSTAQHASAQQHISDHNNSHYYDSGHHQPPARDESLPLQQPTQQDYASSSCTTSFYDATAEPLLPQFDETAAVFQPDDEIDCTTVHSRTTPSAAGPSTSFQTGSHTRPYISTQTVPSQVDGTFQVEQTAHSYLDPLSNDSYSNYETCAQPSSVSAQPIPSGRPTRIRTQPKLFDPSTPQVSKHILFTGTTSNKWLLQRLVVILSVLKIRTFDPFGEICGRSSFEFIHLYSPSSTCNR